MGAGSNLLDAVLQSDNLPTLPVVAVKILSVTDGDELELPEITDIISRDASLCARILKVVNSPLYGLWNPVGTVRKAVSILGIHPVRSLVLSFSLLGMKGNRKEDPFEYERFWEHSLATAVATRWLLKELEAPEEEEGFTAGLLGNIGQMLLARACPDRYGRVVQAKNASDRSLSELEREIVGVDHGAVGGEISRRWRLPQSLRAAIEYHDAPESYSGSENLKRLVRTVHLAEILADMFHSSAPHLLKGRFLRRSQELLGLGEDAFQRLSAGVHEEVRQAADYFGINVGITRSIEEILQEANARIGRVSLSYEQMKQEMVKTQIELIQVNRALQTPKNLHGMAEVDGLTGAWNHRYLQRFLQEELARSLREGNPPVLLLIDADDFRALVTSVGDDGGDHILCELCHLLRGFVGAEDLIARCGGEEFALVLNGTALKEGVEIAEKIREAIARHGFILHEKEWKLTVSIGVASPHPGGCSSADLLHRARLAVQQGKDRGKNRVVAAGEAIPWDAATSRV